MIGATITYVVVETSRIALIGYMLVVTGKRTVNLVKRINTKDNSKNFIIQEGKVV